jgi:hypothetical protein
MLPLCMSKQYHQDVFQNLHIPPENLLIQKVTYTHWSYQDHPFAKCNKSTYVTITPLFLSYLNTGPKTKKLKKTLQVLPDEFVRRKAQKNRLMDNTKQLLLLTCNKKIEHKENTDNAC